MHLECTQGMEMIRRCTLIVAHRTPSFLYALSFSSPLLFLALIPNLMHYAHCSMLFLIRASHCCLSVCTYITQSLHHALLSVSVSPNISAVAFTVHLI